VAIDATVVRMVLVPSTMALLGNANWWLPAWLDRILPHLDLEGGATHGEPAPTAPAEEPVGTVPDGPTGPGAEEGDDDIDGARELEPVG
jgi:RND superfamily putative drug exporter